MVYFYLFSLNFWALICPSQLTVFFGCSQYSELYFGHCFSVPVRLQMKTRNHSYFVKIMCMEWWWKRKVLLRAWCGCLLLFSIFMSDSVDLAEFTSSIVALYWFVVMWFIFSNVTFIKTKIQKQINENINQNSKVKFLLLYFPTFSAVDMEILVHF